MRRHGERLVITSGKYAGHNSRVESNVNQRIVDYPDKWANGHHDMLDSEELVTVRWQVDRVEIEDDPQEAGIWNILQESEV